MKKKIIKFLNYFRLYLSKLIKHTIPTKDDTKSSFDNYKNDMLRESYNHFKEHFKSSVFITNKMLHFDYSIRKSIELNGGKSDGLFMEFGVYKGANVNYISRYAEKVYGFDTFTGLTEDWTGGNVNHFKGSYSLGGKVPKVNKNVTLIKGDVRDTLEDFLKNNNSKITFCSIDIDTYETTKFILSKIKHKFSSNTIIHFDEFYDFVGWMEGEYKAFREEIENDESFTFNYLAFTKDSSAVTVEVKKK